MCTSQHRQLGQRPHPKWRHPGRRREISTAIDHEFILRDKRIRQKQWLTQSTKERLHSLTNWTSCISNFITETMTMAPRHARGNGSMYLPRATMTISTITHCTTLTICVFPPTSFCTAVRATETLEGKHWKKEPKILANPWALNSWLGSMA